MCLIVSKAFGIRETLRFDSSVPWGFKRFTALSLNFSLILGEHIELLIISLNPIPTRLSLIKDSVLLILFLPISGIDIEIFDSTSILLNPYTRKISSITSISLYTSCL